MLAKIAWRNVWRSPLRSFVVIGSVAVGIWSVITLLGFSYGLIQSFIDNALRYQVSHIQMHNPDFPEDKDIQFMLPDADKQLEEIKAIQGVESATVRTLVNGMISTAAGTRGGVIRGVNPQSEAETTSLKEKITEGSYFTDKKNQLIIGAPLAKKLNLRLRKKVVLQFQKLDGEIVSGAFRIAGIFDTNNTIFDEMNVFVNRTDLNRLLGQADAAHEIAIYLKDVNTLDASVAALQAKFPNALTENYRKISPGVNLYETNIGLSATVFIFLFMLALIFGIINTMLMAVLERNKELGMLMAVGMNKVRIFKMIISETLILGIIGAPIGLFLAWLTTIYFQGTGLDLTAFSAGLEKLGMSTVIYPVSEPGLYLKMTVAVVVTALLASIYPAWRAIKLRPVEAMRKI